MKTLEELFISQFQDLKTENEKLRELIDTYLKIIEEDRMQNTFLKEKNERLLCNIQRIKEILRVEINAESITVDNCFIYHTTPNYEELCDILKEKEEENE